MNIFNKITLQSMKKSRTRTLVTIIGVILSAAMITGIATFGTSLLAFLLNGSIEKYGNWHVAFVDATTSFGEALIHDDQVTSTTSYENIGYAMLEDGKSPDKPYLFIAGFNEETFDSLPVKLINGRMPENNHEIVIPEHVALKGGVRFRVGDTLSLSVGNRMEQDKTLNQHDAYRSKEKAGEGEEVLVPKEDKTYTVVGICERPGFEEHASPGYTLITKVDPNDQGDSFSYFVTLKSPHEVKEYAKNMVGEGDYVLNEYVLRFMGISDNKLFNTLLYTVGGILAVIIMVGSIFLIYNSFHISLNERTRQFGILASVGATPKQLRNSVLFEGLCIGAVGIPIGIIVGIGSIGLLLPIVAEKFASIIPSGVPLTLSVSFPAIVAAAVFSLITILISAYLPAKKAANRPVMESIRQTNEIKTSSKEVRTSKFTRRIYGLEGILALKNFKRNKKRYQSIVLSLVLSVVLFVSGSAFGTTVKRLSKQLTMDMDYDIFFTTQEMQESQILPLFDKLKTVDGVYDSSFQEVFSYSCEVKISDLSNRYRDFMGYDETKDFATIPVDVQFIDDTIYLKFVKELGLSEQDYTGQDAKMIALAKKRINEKDGSAKEVFDIFAKRSISLTLNPEPNEASMGKQMKGLDVTLADTYPLDPPPKALVEQKQENPDVFMMVLPYSLKEKFAIPEEVQANVSLGFLSKNPSNSVKEMEALIQGEGITSSYKLYNAYAVLEQFHSGTFVIDVFTYVFVIMISLIAVANVFNTISTNIKLRRRELAMLRSVGMSDKDFTKMMNFECIFYGMWTLLFGIPLATLSSWLIFKGIVIAEQTDHLSYAFPWGSMAISVVGVLFIVFITMLYAIRKIKKDDIIDALRDDMT